VLAFARHLCSPVVSGAAPGAVISAEEEEEVEAFNTKALYACLTLERPEALALTVELHHIPRALAARSAPFASWLPPAQLRLALAYYGLLSAKPRPAGCSLPLLAQPLVARHLLVQVRTRVEAILRERGVWNAPPKDDDGSGGRVADYCRGAGFPPRDAEAARTLATALILDAVPSPQRLARARTAIASHLSQGGASGAAVPLAAAALQDVPASTVVRVAPLLVP